MQKPGLLFVTVSADPVTVIVCEASRMMHHQWCRPTTEAPPSAGNPIINDNNNARKRNGAAGVKKWRVAEFGHLQRPKLPKHEKGHQSHTCIEQDARQCAISRRKTY